MTSNQENLMYEIHMMVKDKGLTKQFEKQLKRMRAQDKHKYKETAERWEYAYNKIK
jgi:hypothetical protein